MSIYIHTDICIYTPAQNDEHVSVHTHIQKGKPVLIIGLSNLGLIKQHIYSQVISIIYHVSK